VLPTTNLSTAFLTWDEEQELDVLERNYTFYTDGICHKYGFGDGDMLNNVFFHFDTTGNHHDLLYLFVSRFVVPKITNHKVELYFMHTGHNPVRARTVDDIEVLYPVDDRFAFEPETVTYTGKEIVHLLGSCQITPSMLPSVTG
jgi:hypothetical protein